MNSTPEDTPRRELIAKAIHDGPNAQTQYRNAGIAPHTWEGCPYQVEYLLDADAVLEALVAASIIEATQ